MSDGDVGFCFADFEYARLLACQGDKEGARTHLELVLSGKSVVVVRLRRRSWVF